MKHLSLLIGLFLVIFSAGCSSKEQVYEHIYEGLKMRERMEQHPAEIALQEQISYDRYKKETGTDREPEPPLPGEIPQ
ncbi:MAG: hypothetical protein D9V46_10295 [Deltaproteobacteria bacterium]|jgi:hypothetical protein|uniref:hypothetical protein n=1 Tax=Hydrosulfovibrio ferrireducens TaxID=2934181 RepID=UPI00120B1067|nr:MAG: hypothetical protein D9V46_10295 [Deltaproteobacteria bacterium]